MILSVAFRAHRYRRLGNPVKAFRHQRRLMRSIARMRVVTQKERLMREEGAVSLS